MADGQDTLNQLNAAPVNPVQTVPSAPSTATVQNPTAADVLAGIQAAQTAPAPANLVAPNVMTAAPNLPAQAAPDVHEHLSWMHRTMDRLATILGGGETLEATKDADGNMQVSRRPSTTSEKWGRIAAAALGGAAQGLAQSQGPGGMARAAAAGTQYGLQLPQQQQQQVQQEATAEQQLQLRNAQKAYLQQQIATNVFNMKAQGIKLKQDLSDSANQGQQWVLSNPSNKDLGNFSDMDAVIKYENTHGNLIQGHAGGAFHTEVQPDGSIQLYNVDRSWMDAKNDKAVDIPRLDPGSTATAPMVLGYDHIEAGTHTNREISLMREGRMKQITDYNIKASAAEEKAQTAQETAAERRQRDQEMQQYREESLALRRQQISAGTYTPGATAGTQFGGGDPNSSFETTSQKLADGTLLLSELPSRGAKGQPTRQDYIARADQIDRANGGTGYTPAQAEQENKFAANPKVQAAVNGIDRIIAPNGQFDQLLRLTDKAKLDHAAPINALTLRANKFMGDQDAKNFLTGLEETRRSIAGLMGNPLLGGSETDRKLQQAQDMLGENPTRDNIRSAHDVLTQALQTQRQAMVDNNRFLRRRFGATGNIPAATAPSAAGPTTTPSLINVPAGGKVYHFQTQEQADAFKENARKQGVNIP